MIKLQGLTSWTSPIAVSHHDVASLMCRGRRHEPLQTSCQRYEHFQDSCLLLRLSGSTHKQPNSGQLSACPLHQAQFIHLCRNPETNRVPSAVLMPALASCGWVRGKAHISLKAVGSSGTEVALASESATAFCLSRGSQCLAVLDSRGALRVLQLTR